MLLALFSTGCASVQQEQGLRVDLFVQGVDAPSELHAAAVSVRSIQLVPCQLAWSPLDLLGTAAHADHSVESPTTAVFSTSTSLLGMAASAVLHPPPDSWCYARVVVEPLPDAEDSQLVSVLAESAAGSVSSSRVGWLDLPLDLGLSEDHPTAQVHLSFSLADWPAAADAGGDALFETALDAVDVHVR